MDVCYFNYRGYNLSEGVPTPDLLKSDGMCIFRYLRDVLGMTSIVLHGESVGGMVAAHIARQVCAPGGEEYMNMVMGISSPADADIELGHLGASGGGGGLVKAVVLDRTFCSLDAVASQMLGAWAAYVIRLLNYFFLIDLSLALVHSIHMDYLNSFGYNKLQYPYPYPYPPFPSL